jgi:hypothetical protein
MNIIERFYPILIFSIIISTSTYGQNTADAFSSEDTPYELKNDTLFFSSGLKITIGQKVILGTGAGTNGRYRSIISQYAAVVPRIWGKNPNFENDIENHVDNKKGRKQVKELIPGDHFIIKRIILMGKKNKYHYYLAFLSSDKNNYKCDLALALKLNELLLSL